MRVSFNHKLSESGHLVVVCLVLSLILAIGVPWNVVRVSSVEPLPNLEMALTIEPNQQSDGSLLVDVPQNFRDVELPLLDPVTQFPVKNLYGLHLFNVDSVELDNGVAFGSHKYRKTCFVLWDNGFLTKHNMSCTAPNLAEEQDFLTLYKFSPELANHPEVLASVSARAWKQVVRLNDNQLQVDFDPNLGLKSLYSKVYLAIYQKDSLFKKSRFSGGIELNMT